MVSLCVIGTNNTYQLATIVYKFAHALIHIRTCADSHFFIHCKIIFSAAVSVYMEKKYKI